MSLQTNRQHFTKLAKSNEGFIDLSLRYLKSVGKEVALKAQQEQAISVLLLGRDVLAVLPTGFGKSLIFTVFHIALAKSFQLESQSTLIGSRSVSVLVVAPLQSIIEDQIAGMLDIKCTAMQLSPSTVEKILEDPPQFVFATAEQVLEKRFLDALKDNTSKLHFKLCAVVVDESHTVETWSGKR